MSVFNNLNKLKKKCDKLYYEKGIQKISDEEYDLSVNLLKDLQIHETDNCIIPSKPGNVKLPVPMWSLNKIREFKIPKNITSCILMDKLDGISCLLTNEKAFSRGNGIFGQDISNMINPDLFLRVPKGYLIRGELVIKKKYLYKIYSSTRTMVCSFVARNEFSELIDFIAYELISLENLIDYDLNTQFDILKKNNFKTVYFENFNVLHNLLFDEFLTKRIKESEYDIDGIVVSYNGMQRCAKKLLRNPLYSVAFKRNFVGVKTTVLNIEWNLGKTQTFTPVIHIKPVEISGSIIKKVTGHNLNYLKRKKIGIGSIVEVIKSGHVIPHIIKVETFSEDINIPNDCDENGKFISSNNNDIRIIKSKFLFFVKTLGIKGVGPKKVEELINLKITPEKIISNGITIFDFLPKSKVNEKIISNFKEKLESCSNTEFLVSMSAFGIGIGIKKANYLLEKDEFKELIELKEKNFGKNSFILNNNEQKNPEIHACISGSRDKQIEGKINLMGYKCSYTITKKTKVLFVIGEKNISNKKVENAKNKNIDIKYI